MTRRYSLSDPNGPLDRLIARVHALETGTPLASASLRRGRTRILSETGEAVAILGHYAGQAGFLLPRAGAWLTVQDYTAAELAEERAYIEGRIAQSHEWPNARLDAIDEWRNQFGPTVNSLGARMNAVEGAAFDAAVDAAEAQTTANEAKASASEAKASAGEALQTAKSLTGAGTTFNQPKLSGPTIDGIGSGGVGGGWTQLLINPSTGQIRYYGD